MGEIPPTQLRTRTSPPPEEDLHIPFDLLSRFSYRKSQNQMAASPQSGLHLVSAHLPSAPPITIGGYGAVPFLCVMFDGGVGVGGVGAGVVGVAGVTTGTTGGTVGVFEGPSGVVNSPGRLYSDAHLTMSSSFRSLDDNNSSGDG